MKRKNWNLIGLSFLLVFSLIFLGIFIIETLNPIENLYTKKPTISVGHTWFQFGAGQIYAYDTVKVMDNNSYSENRCLSIDASWISVDSYGHGLSPEQIFWDIYLFTIENYNIWISCQDPRPTDIPAIERHIDSNRGFFNRTCLDSSKIYVLVLYQRREANVGIDFWYEFAINEIYDVDGPNIVSVIQDPLIPTCQDIVNVTVRVTDGAEIQTVHVETNYTGVLATYPMTRISGTLQDGIWEFSFNSYQFNKDISYRIYTKDIFGNSNVSIQSSFRVCDDINPSFISVTQDPAILDRREAINISVHVQDNGALAVVQLESNHTGTLTNHTMDHLSGTLQNGIWNYTITNWPVNETIGYQIFAIDIGGRITVSEFYHFSIPLTIEWSVPRDLEFEINLDEGEDYIITFNFENTGTTTLLNLNFTLDLPLGWTTETASVLIHRLAPQESASLLFRITPPDSADEFLEVISIDFEVSVLETGETYADAITIIVTGKTTNDFIIWVIVMVGSISGVASANLVVFRRRRKKHRIRPLLNLAINAPKRSHAEVTESAVGEGTDSTELFEENPARGSSAIAPEQLLKVLNGILESFPSLARQFPRAAHVKFLMEEVRYPYNELLPFISSLLASVSVSELRTQMCVRMNAFRGSHDEGNVMHALHKIDELLYWAESTSDRPLLNDLFQLLLLIECS